MPLRRWRASRHRFHGAVPAFVQHSHEEFLLAGEVVIERTSRYASSAGVRLVHWDELDAFMAPDLGVSGDGRFLVLWPSPVDHDTCFERAGFSGFADTNERWHADFSGLVGALCRFMAPAGRGRLAKGAYPRELGISSTVRRLLGLATTPTNAEDALVAAALDDRFDPCVVHFGTPAQAAIRASGGHPLLWTWTSRDTFETQDLLATLAGSFPLVNRSLDWRAVT